MDTIKVQLAFCDFFEKSNLTLSNLTLSKLDENDAFTPSWTRLAGCLNTVVPSSMKCDAQTWKKNVLLLRSNMLKSVVRIDRESGTIMATPLNNRLYAVLGLATRIAHPEKDCCLKMGVTHRQVNRMLDLLYPVPAESNDESDESDKEAGMDDSLYDCEPDFDASSESSYGHYDVVQMSWSVMASYLNAIPGVKQKPEQWRKFWLHLRLYVELNMAENKLFQLYEHEKRLRSILLREGKIVHNKNASGNSSNADGDGDECLPNDNKPASYISHAVVGRTDVHTMMERQTAATERLAIAQERCAAAAEQKVSALLRMVLAQQRCAAAAEEKSCTTNRLSKVIESMAESMPHK